VPTLPSHIDPEAPVRVFKNLKHGCFSIMQGGRICASARAVRLAEVELRVRAAGRERMLRERRRNVHAFAVGRLVDFVHPGEPRTLGPLAGRRAYYDPYRFSSFVDRETSAPLLGAAVVQLDESGIRYVGGRPGAPEFALPDAA